MNINEKIKLTKEHVKNLTSHFPYTKKEINYLTIAYLAMTIFDESIEDLLDTVLTKTYCLFTNLSLDEAYDTYILNGIDNSSKKGCYGLYEGYYYDDKGALSYVPFIIISISNENEVVDIFDTLTHELKHAINEIILKTTKKGFYSGLSYVKKRSRICHDGLDEAFNSFLTGIYLQIISNLSYMNIEIKGIRDILERFYLSNEYFYSYNHLITPILPLLKSKKLFWGLYNAVLYKDNTELEKAINDIFGNSINLKDFIDLFDSPKFNPDYLMKEAISEEIAEEYILPRI